MIDEQVASSCIPRTGILSQTRGFVPGVLIVPQPVRAYSVQRNTRLVSTMNDSWPGDVGQIPSLMEDDCAYPQEFS
jgi:hypothetical protein